MVAMVVFFRSTCARIDLIESTHLCENWSDRVDVESERIDVKNVVF